MPHCPRATRRRFLICRVATLEEAAVAFIGFIIHRHSPSCSSSVAGEGGHDDVDEELRRRQLQDVHGVP